MSRKRFDEAVKQRRLGKFWVSQEFYGELRDSTELFAILSEVLLVKQGPKLMRDVHEFQGYSYYFEPLAVNEIVPRYRLFAETKHRVSKDCLDSVSVELWMYAPTFKRLGTRQGLPFSNTSDNV